MYNCAICSTTVGPRVPRRLHTVYRKQRNGARGSIATEYPVCEPCQIGAEIGVPFSTLRAANGPKDEEGQPIHRDEPAPILPEPEEPAQAEAVPVRLSKPVKPVFVPAKVEKIPKTPSRGVGKAQTNMPASKNGTRKK